MKISRLLSLLAVLAFSVSSARADYIATLLQVGPNVVMTGTGAINLTGLTFDPNASFQTSAFLNPSSGVVVMGPAAFIDLYAGLTGPTSFGSGGPSAGASSFSGDHVSFVGFNGTLVLPDGYISNTVLSSGATYNNATFATLGATPGTYVWSWGTGANQTLTLVIGGATVPESGSSIALLFLSAGALFGAKRLRSLRSS